MDRRTSRRPHREEEGEVAMTVRVVDVEKRELPMAVVLRDGCHVRVMELAPAGQGKLGAYLREPDEARRREILKKIAKQ